LRIHISADRPNFRLPRRDRAAAFAFATIQFRRRSFPVPIRSAREARQG